MTKLDFKSVTPHTKRFFKCPGCEVHEFSCEHMWQDWAQYGHSMSVQKTVGPWYCDNCGKGWYSRYSSDGALEVAEAKLSVSKTFVLLEILPKAESIFLVVQGKTFSRESEDPEYYYNEGTCPSNYFRAVSKVHYKNDDDPHGLAVFRGEMLAPEDANGEVPSPMQILLEGEKAKEKP